MVVCVLCVTSPSMSVTTSEIAHTLFTCLTKITLEIKSQSEQKVLKGTRSVWCTLFIFMSTNTSEIGCTPFTPEINCVEAIQNWIVPKTSTDHSCVLNEWHPPILQDSNGQCHWRWARKLWHDICEYIHCSLWIYTSWWRQHFVSLPIKLKGGREGRWRSSLTRKKEKGWAEQRYFGSSWVFDQLEQRSWSKQCQRTGA